MKPGNLREAFWRIAYDYNTEIAGKSRSASSALGLGLVSGLGLGLWLAGLLRGGQWGTEWPDPGSFRGSALLSNGTWIGFGCHVFCINFGI